MSTDLHPNPRLEERLREALDAVVPHLMADVVEPAWEGEIGDEFAWDPDPAVDGRRRSGLLGIAAALLLVGGSAAVWATVIRSDPAVVDPATEPTADVAPATFPATGQCFVEECAPVARLLVIDGAFDLFAGPESLGAPVVDQGMLDQFELVRCLELTVDGSACQRIEGLAGVAPVRYPARDVEVGTTFTSVSAMDYATRWGSIFTDGPAPQDVEVRGHPAVLAAASGRISVTWQERDGVLAWVTAPPEMSDELLSIAEDIRTIDGPTTIPFLIATGLGSTWDASGNTSDGVVYARIGEELCVGIGWVSGPCNRVVARHPTGRNSFQVAGLGPSSAAIARIELDGGSSYDFPLTDVPGIRDGGAFVGEVPAIGDSLTLTWLTADGVGLDVERLDVERDGDGIVLTTTGV